MILIDGRKIRDDILVEIKKEVALLPFKPVFCDIMVGNDVVSRQYVNIKMNFAKKAGILCHEAFFPANVKEEELIKEIEKINNLENICGLIVQLPLPSGFNTKRILGSIRKEIDVDSLNNDFENAPTGKAIFYILDSLDLDLENRDILVIGAGPLVGLPVAKILEKRGLKFQVARRETENKHELLKKADIIISGAGDPNFIKGDMIKEGVVLIDAGTSESGGGIVGDVDLESVKNVAGYVSPVPGGVGPVTVAMLFNNVLAVAKNKHE